MNYAARPGGSLGVELQDASGKPVSGFALDDCDGLDGDSVQHVVRWESGTSVEAFAGQPVRLRFVLKNADLYSFQFVSCGEEP